MAAVRAGMPILTSPSSRYVELVERSGACAVWISNDGQTVLKSAMIFDFSGLNEQQIELSHCMELFESSTRYIARETEIYKQLGSHEGILTPVLADIGLIFPYLPRSDLRHVLRTETITTMQRVAWVRSAVNTLVYIHSKGVLVADISTRNILVRDDDTIVICDFSGSGLGSLEPDVYYEPSYGATEGGTALCKVSMATEVFAVGSLIYEIITGEPPYDELEDAEIEQRYREKKFPPHHMLLGSVIGQCWHGVFASSSEVMHAIENQLAQT